MDHEVECPYCGVTCNADLEPHEGEKEIVKCSNCKNNFVAKVQYVEITVEAEKAPCLNGKDRHKQMWVSRYTKGNELFEKRGCFSCGEQFAERQIK